MSRIDLAIALTGALAAVIAVGCSGAESAPTTEDAGLTDTGGAIDTAIGDVVSPPDDAALDTAPLATKPATPTMASTLDKKPGVQATWKLNDTGLSAVELWRKKDSGAYAKLTSLGGAETTSLDATATGMFTYCYKVKTIRDGLESDFSAEKCLMTGM